MTATAPSALDDAARKYSLKGYTITSRTDTQVILQSPPYRSGMRIFVIILLAITLIGLFALPFIGRKKVKTVVLTLQADGTVKVKKGKGRA
ncbi:MAG: hypothetical protein BGO95_11695 [Micrococcales bacterium 73-13]|nr:MAG: hypothetical protein BGO95_11695 [Micrococcales bacterium 73-13]